MLPEPFDDCLILTGPTASGKSSLAVELAQRLNAEIVSMDSMAVYRRMDVGTAKPTPEARRLVPHHLIDVLEPWESASVAWWLERAKECCRDIAQHGKQAMIVGGTPLYLKALMFGLFDGPAADPDIRQRLREEAERLGSTGLHERLTQVDPIAAGRIHANDLRRIIRALEVFELTGRAISDWQQEWRNRDKWSVASGKWPVTAGNASNDSIPLATDHWPLTTVLCLDVPRPLLYERIDHRVEEMFTHGLVGEVRSLRELGRPVSVEASQALGYKEVFTHLDGQCTLADTITLVQARSRQYAKRQISWFRHLAGCRFVTSELTRKLWQPKIEGRDQKSEIWRPNTKV